MVTLEKDTLDSKNKSPSIILQDRIVKALRSVGIVIFNTDGRKKTFIDIPFEIAFQGDKETFYIEIKKRDIPKDFDYSFFLARKALFQFELCLPIEITNLDQTIILEVSPGCLNNEIFMMRYSYGIN
jgi:hypothetical protein